MLFYHTNILFLQTCLINISVHIGAYTQFILLQKKSSWSFTIHFYIIINSTNIILCM